MKAYEIIYNFVNGQSKAKLHKKEIVRAQDGTLCEKNGRPEEGYITCRAHRVYGLVTVLFEYSEENRGYRATQLYYFKMVQEVLNFASRAERYYIPFCEDLQADFNNVWSAANPA